MKEPIVALYEYGEWANARLLDKAEALTPAQLAQPFSKGALAILPTFGHLIGADIRWLARFQNQTPPTLSAADFPSLDVVRRRFEEVRGAAATTAGAECGTVSCTTTRPVPCRPAALPARLVGSRGCGSNTGLRCG